MTYQMPPRKRFETESDYLDRSRKEILKQFKKENPDYQEPKQNFWLRHQILAHLIFYSPAIALISYFAYLLLFT